MFGFRDRETTTGDFDSGWVLSEYVSYFSHGEYLRLVVVVVEEVGYEFAVIG